MNRTKIEYLDYTWNPCVGCTGEGCAVKNVCWARGQAKRRKHICADCYAFKPHYHFERYNQPLAVKKPSRIGVGFMSDIFDSFFSIPFHQKLFATMVKASWHTFLCKTKQSQNMRTFNENWQDLPRNVWMGVSVNCVKDVYRLDDLRQTDAAIRYASFEPLYEDVTDLGHSHLNLEGIDWVIIGAQKRPTLQPKEEWVSNLITWALKAGAKVFLKNNLACIDRFGRLQEIPEVDA